MSVAADTFREIRGADDYMKIDPRGSRSLLSLVRRDPRFKDLARARIDRVGVLSIPFVQFRNIPRIDTLNVLELHSIVIVLHGIGHARERCLTARDCADHVGTEAPRT